MSNYASGTSEPNGEFTRYTLTAGRAFALSTSRDFEVVSLKAGDVLGIIRIRHFSL